MPNLIENQEILFFIPINSIVDILVSLSLFTHFLKCIEITSLVYKEYHDLPNYGLYNEAAYIVQY